MSSNNRQQGWGQPPTNPYNTPAATRRPDVRPLHKRKRVWIGGVVIFAAGAIGGSGNSNDAVALPAPEPTVTVHDTMTVTASPEPAPTVTVKSKPQPRVTVTKTVTKTVTSGSGSGGSSGGGSSVYYQNCTAARAAGDTPLYVGDPGYRSALDRDGDGVACE